MDADRPVDKEGNRVRARYDDSNSPILFGVKKEFRHPFALPAGLELPQDALQAAARIARARGRREETNLLYVAMTRARDRLFVLGGDKDISSIYQILGTTAYMVCSLIMIPVFRRISEKIGKPRTLSISVVLVLFSQVRMMLTSCTTQFQLT